MDDLTLFSSGRINQNELADRLESDIFDSPHVSCVPFAKEHMMICVSNGQGAHFTRYLRFSSRRSCDMLIVKFIIEYSHKFEPHRLRVYHCFGEMRDEIDVQSVLQIAELI